MKQTYGEQLREQIDKNGINQVELAKEYGCTKDNVQKALNSKTMKPATFDKWVQAINSLEQRKENERLRDKLRRIKEIVENESLKT